MPTYAYRCTSCAHEFEIVQKFADSPLTECPECGEHIRRVFQPVGLVFKGSGWYINDSRKSTSDKDAPAAKASTSESTTADTKPAESKSSESSAPATPATPAAAATKVAAD